LLGTDMTFGALPLKFCGQMINEFSLSQQMFDPTRESVWFLSNWWWYSVHNFSAGDCCATMCQSFFEIEKRKIAVVFSHRFSRLTTFYIDNYRFFMLWRLPPVIGFIPMAIEKKPTLTCSDKKRKAICEKW